MSFAEIGGRPLRRSGILFIVSGPSGAGKTSMSVSALRDFPDVALSRSITTRSPRPGPDDAKLYRFVSTDEFTAMRDAGELAEWAEVYGNFYGTPHAPIREALEAGRDILLDIDVQGAEQIKRAYADRSVAIFLLPPDRETLESRLRGRATDSEDVVAGRLRNACLEIGALGAYDYVIVNQDLDVAYSEFSSVLRCERRRVARLSEEGRAVVTEAFREPE
jgi:guanylate kinase